MIEENSGDTEQLRIIPLEDLQLERVASKPDHLVRIENIRDKLWEELVESLVNNSEHDLQVTQDFLVEKLKNPTVIIRFKADYFTEFETGFFTDILLTDLADFIKGRGKILTIIVSVKDTLEDGTFYMLNIFFEVKYRAIYLKSIKAAT